MLPLLKQLLRGDSAVLVEWLHNPSSQRILCCVLTIIIGCGVYGVTLGIWRSPLMGLYVGVKLPILIFFTLACNAALNGTLGLLLGAGLGFRQSMLSLLMSFAVFALILGAASPIMLFLVSNLPSPDSEYSRIAHASYLLIHTFLIAYTGVTANVHLFKCLLSYCPDKRSAIITLLSWLAGNAFVGAQFSWILRPFFGSPELEVAFLREDPFNGTFYGAVGRSVLTITGKVSPVYGILGAVIISSLSLAIFLNHKKP